MVNLQQIKFKPMKQLETEGKAFHSLFMIRFHSFFFLLLLKQKVAYYLVKIESMT